MSTRPFDAVLLDVDGTLLDQTNSIRPRTREVIRALEEDGVMVMLATGRSLLSAVPVLEDLGLSSPAILFNGAGIWCPKEERMLEEQCLSNRSLARTLDFAQHEGLLPVVMKAREKFCINARTPVEERGLRLLEGLQYTDHAGLHVEYAMRVTLFSEHHEPGPLAADVEAAIDAPVYMTHFPLRELADHRESPLAVVDVQPPCLGKAEAFRFLETNYGIPAARVVTFGDSGNDVPMLRGAGLSFAMASGTEAARGAAQRVIGGNDTDAIADALEEVFGAEM